MDITKLDLNWGGPGFAAYEGRLEDESAPLDSQGRAEAALAAFTGEAEAEPEVKAEGQPEGEQVAVEGQPAEGEQQEQQPVEGQLTDDQRNADPVFKELNEFKTAVAEVFDKHGLTAAAEANGRTAQEEADLQLSDAGLLYGIMRGEMTPSQLLDTMVNVGNWTPAQKDTVAANLQEWLKANGYLKDGQSAAGDKKPPAKAGDPGFKDPLEERLKNLETANEKSAREQQERVQQEEKNRVGKVFIDHVTKLATGKGVAKEDIDFYLSQVGAMVNGNPAITGRVAKGNFVDIQRFFDTVHSRQLKMIERFNKAEIEKQKLKGRNPKGTAGGSPPVPAGPAKRNLANRDDRVAAAAEQLRG